jgi:hypothetical protein
VLHQKKKQQWKMPDSTIVIAQAVSYVSLTLIQAWCFFSDPTHCREHCTQHIHEQEQVSILQIG